MERTSPTGGRDLRITAYNENLGFVTERRRLPVTAGLSRIEITDIPAQIDPTSVHLSVEQGEVLVVEQDFQYDLAGPDRILQRYLDHPVEAVLKEGGIKRGDLLSYDDQTLVLRSEDGEIGLLRRSEVVDTRLPKLPEGLRTRPTLLWALDASTPGDAVVELSYLTAGVAWHAEYVAVTNEDDSEIELAAWISLENRCGAGFSDARLQLVAGRIHRVRTPWSDRPEEARVKFLGQGVQQVHEEPLFEYHLYTVERPVTIADRETKQLALFPSVTTPATKSYRYEGGSHSRDVHVFMELENRKDRGLGMPLPGGTLRTYKRDSRGRLHFIGEDRVDHTPRNEKIRLKLGAVFDVVGERRVLSQTHAAKQVDVEEIEVRIRNHKREAIAVVAREYLWAHWHILKSTHKYTSHDANTLDFELEVPADGEQVLNFSYRHGA